MDGRKYRCKWHDKILSINNRILLKMVYSKNCGVFVVKKSIRSNIV